MDFKNLSKEELANLLQETLDKNQELEQKITSLEHDKYMFQALMETIPDHIYFKDRQSHFLLLSSALIRWFNKLDVNEVYGKTDFDIFTTGKHAREAYDDEQKIMETGISVVNKEEKEEWEDGSFTWVSTSKAPLRDKDNRIIGIVGISRNITDKKLSDEKLQEYKDNLEKAKRETDNILAYVDEGLFLLNKALNIGTQYSRVSEKIFESKKLANTNFIKLLINKTDKKTIDSAEQYLNLLFSTGDAALISDLNPLNEVQLRFGKISKFLSFNFTCIKNTKGEVDELIATVNDITKEVILARSLEETKAENKRKMDWLLSILNIDPIMLREFINAAENEVFQVQENMQLIESREDKEENLTSIYRSIHTIKGNASLLELDFVSIQAHKIEDYIDKLIHQKKTDLNDFLDLEQEIHLLEKIIAESKGLIDQIGKIHEQFRPKRNHENKRFIQSLEKLIASLSEKYNKKVVLESKNYNSDNIPYEHRLIVRDIIVQLIRNSMIHGIESPAERTKSKKPARGRIKISNHVHDNNYQIHYEDDGRGLQLNALREKALKSGKWKEEAIDRMDNKQIAEIIFVPGISTSDKADLASGRGMGMDIVKKNVEKSGGKISVEFEQGKFCKFILTMPLNK
ncbi:MAG: PAS domain-containing protein [Calditrichaceae bacterium]|nr:PAS domain-containing protein [Calditrichaceae bacterium]MBN2708548.1 PAS domain-containing protein [Calditrichaceae bacterium]